MSATGSASAQRASILGLPGVGALVRWLLFVLRDILRTINHSSSADTKGDRGLIEKVFGYPPAKLDPSRDTAWLDGLRGVAAFLVMTYHFNLEWMGLFVEAPYRGLPDSEWQLWRLPFVRLLFCSGHAQVSVFFVLSGFVLSWSSLGSIRSGRHEKIAQSLSSSVFRRWLRLYIPCFVVGLFSFLQIYMGWLQIPGVSRKDTFFGQLWDYILACERFANPFRLERGPNGGIHAYNWTFWTIPAEFAGSLFVFVCLLAISRLRSYARRTFVLGLIVAYACWSAEWNYWLFGSGMLLADYVKEAGGFQNLSDGLSFRKRMFWTVVLLVGLYLSGFPERSEHYTRPGYDFLHDWIPRQYLPIEGGQRFWWCWAGIFVISGLSHLSLRRVFERPFMRYLGRVSFMLYLTHRTVLEVVGRSFRAQMQAPVKYKAWNEQFKVDLDVVDQPWWFVIYAISWIVLGPLSLCLAHWCEVLIDAPSTRFARWVDDQFVKGFTPESEVTEAEELVRLPV